MSESSGSLVIVVSAVILVIGGVVLLAKMISGAGNIHPLICWHISPAYNAAACLAETTKFD